MPFGGLLAAGIGAGGSIISGLIGSSAASKAAKQQRAAALQAQGINDSNTQRGVDAVNRDTAETKGTYNTLFQPYTDLGSTAAGKLNGALQDPFKFNLQDDPGYAFRLKQGADAVSKSAAAAGGAVSGGALKALTQYGQGFASNEYSNAFARNQQQLQNLFQGTGIGLNAATTQAGGIANANQNETGLTTNLLNNNSALASQNFTGAGNAAAAGTVGSANALGGAVNNLGQTANQLFLYNLLKGPGVGAGGNPYTPIDTSSFPGSPLSAP